MDTSPINFEFDTTTIRKKLNDNEKGMKRIPTLGGHHEQLLDQLRVRH